MECSAAAPGVVMQRLPMAAVMLYSGVVFVALLRLAENQSMDWLVRCEENECGLLTHPRAEREQIGWLATLLISP